MPLKMIQINLGDSQELDISLVLNSLRKEKGKTHEKVVSLFMYKYNIKEICEITKLSRYKVNKILKESFNYIREILEKEGY